MSDVTVFVIVAAFFWVSGYQAGRAHYIGMIATVSDLPPGRYTTMSELSFLAGHGCAASVQSDGGTKYTVASKYVLPDYWERRFSLWRLCWYAHPLSKELNAVETT